MGRACACCGSCTENDYYFIVDRYAGQTKILWSNSEEVYVVKYKPEFFPGSFEGGPFNDPDVGIEKIQESRIIESDISDYGYVGKSDYGRWGDYVYPEEPEEGFIYQKYHKTSYHGRGFVVAKVNDVFDWGSEFILGYHLLFYNSIYGIQDGIIKAAKSENIPKNARDFDELFDDSVRIGVNDIAPEHSRRSSIDLEDYIEKSNGTFIILFDSDEPEPLQVDGGTEIFYTTNTYYLQADSWFQLSRKGETDYTYSDDFFFLPDEEGYNYPASFPIPIEADWHDCFERTGDGVYISTCQYLNDVFKFDEGGGFLGLTYFTSGGELKISLVKEATGNKKSQAEQVYFSENFKMIVEPYEFEIPAVYERSCEAYSVRRESCPVDIYSSIFDNEPYYEETVYDLKPMLQLVDIDPELDLDCFKIIDEPPQEIDPIEDKNSYYWKVTFDPSEDCRPYEERRSKNFNQPLKYEQYEYSYVWSLVYGDQTIAQYKSNISSTDEVNERVEAGENLYTNMIGGTSISARGDGWAYLDGYDEMHPIGPIYFRDCIIESPRAFRYEEDLKSYYKRSVPYKYGDYNKAKFKFELKNQKYYPYMLRRQSLGDYENGELLECIDECEGGPAELHWRVYDESLASLGDPVEHTLADHKGCYLELFAVMPTVEYYGHVTQVSSNGGSYAFYEPSEPEIFLLHNVIGSWSNGGFAAAVTVEVLLGSLGAYNLLGETVTRCPFPPDRDTYDFGFGFGALNSNFGAGISIPSEPECPGNKCIQTPLTQGGYRYTTRAAFADYLDDRNPSCEQWTIGFDSGYSSIFIGHHYGSTSWSKSYITDSSDFELSEEVFATNHKISLTLEPHAGVWTANPFTGEFYDDDIWEVFWRHEYDGTKDVIIADGSGSSTFGPAFERDFKHDYIRKYPDEFKGHPAYKFIPGAGIRLRINDDFFFKVDEGEKYTRASTYEDFNILYQQFIPSFAADEQISEERAQETAKYITNFKYWYQLRGEIFIEDPEGDEILEHDGDEIILGKTWTDPFFYIDGSGNISKPYNSPDFEPTPIAHALYDNVSIYYIEGPADQNPGTDAEFSEQNDLDEDTRYYSLNNDTAIRYGDGSIPAMDSFELTLCPNYFYHFLRPSNVDVSLYLNGCCGFGDSSNECHIYGYWEGLPVEPGEHVTYDAEITITGPAKYQVGEFGAPDPRTGYYCLGHGSLNPCGTGAEGDPAGPKECHCRSSLGVHNKPIQDGVLEKGEEETFTVKGSYRTKPERVFDQQWIMVGEETMSSWSWSETIADLRTTVERFHISFKKSVDRMDCESGADVKFNSDDILTNQGSSFAISSFGYTSISGEIEEVEGSDGKLYKLTNYDSWGEFYNSKYTTKVVKSLKNFASDDNHFTSSIDDLLSDLDASVAASAKSILTSINPDYFFGVRGCGPLFMSRNFYDRLERRSSTFYLTEVRGVDHSYHDAEEAWIELFGELGSFHVLAGVANGNKEYKSFSAVVGGVVPMVYDFGECPKKQPKRSPSTVCFIERNLERQEPTCNDFGRRGAGFGGYLAAIDEPVDFRDYKFSLKLEKDDEV